MSHLETAFITLLNMSITASYVAAAVIAARLLLKKAPKVYSYALWSVVLFRLVFPFSFSAGYSLLGLIQPVQGSSAALYIPQDIGLMKTPAVDTGLGSLNTAVNGRLPAATPLASINPLQVWITLGTFIWLLGVAVLCIYAVITYLRLRKQVCMATLVADNIYESDLIGSPFVCGLVKPKIYLPLGLAEPQRGFILRHEQVHIRRRDYLVKPLAFLALALHWFNPLLWLSFSLMSKDMEMSCDEQVIQNSAGGDAVNYSSSLLALATQRILPAPGPLAFGESNVKARIKNVLNYRKPAFRVTIASIAAVTVLGVILLANPPKGYSIYEHPKSFLSQDSLRAPAKVRIVDNANGAEYVFTDRKEIAKVTAIVEDMRVAKKEISRARGGEDDSRYSISYGNGSEDSTLEYSYTVHVAPVWIDNNVKPSLRFKLVNEKDTLKRLKEILAAQESKPAEKASYDIESLLRNKTPYIGNNSKVVGLIDALPLPEGVIRESVKLHTSEPPYGITISYRLEDDSARIGEEQFLRNSLLLFALIGNAGEVTHQGYWNNKMLSSVPFRYTYTREDAEKVVAGDIRQFAANQESLALLVDIVQLLSED